MSNQSVLLLISIIFLSLGLSYLQYIYKIKNRSATQFILFVLRFFSYATIGVLLLNPVFENFSTEIQKRNLVVLVDDSASIARIGDTAKVKSFMETLSKDTEIAEKFNLQSFKFGESFSALDTLQFLDRQTNIAQALQSADQIFNANEDAFVLITDGNQSVGQDFKRFAQQKNLSILPVVVGDTIAILDAKIDLVNANSYSFLGNQFPVEVFVSYNGTSTENTELQLLHKGKIIATKSIGFTQTQNSQQLVFQVDANQVGLQTYTLKLKPIAKEKFLPNNNYQFGLEVIDERSKIMLATAIWHPDLGMWKRSIETNKQRQVDIVRVDKESWKLDDYQAVIYYQPTEDFSKLMQDVEKKGLGTMMLTGTQTDYELVNSSQAVFRKDPSNSYEEYYPVLNKNYTTFQVEELDYEDFPPVEDVFGEVVFLDEYQPILFQKIQSITTETPLLFSYTKDSSKNVVLFGENTWRWRSQHFVQNQSFENFDTFVSSLIQYISASEYKQRLVVNSSNFYNEGENTQLSVKFYDANYQLLPSAEVNIQVTNETTKEQQDFPMVFLNSQYVFNTAALPAGDYTYTISEKETKLTKNGKFTIVDYNPENQFSNSNVSALKALHTNQVVYHLENPTQLKEFLLQPNYLQPIQKQVKINQSLIDWVFLLIFLAVTLFCEWFIRKYKGFI